MNKPIGYVVVEYNQASGLPATSGQVHFTVEDARIELELAERVTRDVGRRETFTIAKVVELGGDEFPSVLAGETVMHRTIEEALDIVGGQFAEDLHQPKESP